MFSNWCFSFLQRSAIAGDKANFKRYSKSVQVEQKLSVKAPFYVPKYWQHITGTLDLNQETESSNPI